MILYHGSNFEFDTIDLSKCRPGTDFGQGFYLTPLKEQAEERARGKVRAFGGEAVVSAWEYDEALSHDLKTLTFDLESKEWAEFVFKNRTLEDNPENTYDIICGPVADDNLRMLFNLVRRGLLSIDELASRLVYDKPNMQYCFRTVESLKCLRKK